jgi:beta-alanine degradation protein BauB
MPVTLKYILVAIVTMAATITVLRSQEAPAKTQRIPQFENEDVKVWKSIVMPNAPLTMHHHDHPRVIIALSGGTMKLVDSTGTSETHVWDTGKAYWLPANPPNTTHADVNTGDKPIEVMVVELEKEK